MKSKIEPERLRKILKAGMLYDTKPMIDPTIGVWGKDGVSIREMFTDVIAVDIQLKPSFFLEFSAEDETLAIPLIFLERLGWGFKDDEMVISTKNDNLYLDGKFDHYDHELDDAEVGTFPFEIKETKEGNLSVILNAKTPIETIFKSHVLLNASEFSLPPSGNYIFERKGKKVSVRIPGEGNFERKLKAEKVVGTDDAKVSLDGKFFGAISGNLEGKVHFYFNEDVAVFRENRKDSIKTYLLSAQDLE